MAKVTKAKLVITQRSARWYLVLECGHIVERPVRYAAGAPTGHVLREHVKPAPKRVRSCEKCFRDDFWHKRYS